MKTCKECRYFDYDAESRDSQCYYLPPKSTVIMTESVAGKRPVALGYRPKVNEGDKGCVYFVQDSKL